MKMFDYCKYKACIAWLCVPKMAPAMGVTFGPPGKPGGCFGFAAPCLKLLLQPAQELESTLCHIYAERSLPALIMSLPENASCLQGNNHLPS